MHVTGDSRVTKAAIVVVIATGDNAVSLRDATSGAELVQVATPTGYDHSSGAACDQ